MYAGANEIGHSYIRVSPKAKGFIFGYHDGRTVAVHQQHIDRIICVGVSVPQRRQLRKDQLGTTNAKETIILEAYKYCKRRDNKWLGDNRLSL